MSSFTGIVWVDNSTPRANWWGDISALNIGKFSSSFHTYAHGIAGHIQFRTTMLFQLPISSSLNSSNLLHRYDPIPLYMTLPLAGATAFSIFQSPSALPSLVI